MKDKSKVLASWGRVFIAATLAQFFAMGGDIFSIDMEGLKTILASGASATLLVVYKYFDPKDQSYGVVK